MPEQPPRSGEESPDNASDQDVRPRLKSSGEVVVEHHAVPPKGPEDKRIQPRRPLPLVPNAPAKEDDEKIPGSSD